MRRLLIIVASIAFAVASAGDAQAGAVDADLMAAIKAANADGVRAALSRGASVTNADPDGTTPMHWAVHVDDSTVVALLLEAGADANAADRYDLRPITLACTNGNAAIVELLLNAGAEANTTWTEGETALMTAARTGSVEVVTRLLDHGADVNVVETWRGQTALMWAAAEGHADVIPPMLSHGADLTLRSTNGWSPLLFAAREGQIDVARILLEAGADVESALPVVKQETTTNAASGRTATGLDAFLLAAANAHYELAALLADHGADVNNASRGWTALHQVSWVRKAGIAGSNNPAPEGSGTMTSLEFVRRIVAAGADVNARVTTKPPAGITRLHFIGGTPFLLAARTGDADLMRVLAELGADPLLPNEQNTTPIMVAAGVGTSAPGEDPGTESEVLDAVQVAMQLGGDLNEVDDNGETVMHGAAYKHLPKVVAFLAEAGAEIDVWNQPNSHGSTPLDIVDAVAGNPNVSVSPSPATAAAIREVMAAAGVHSP